MWFVVTSGLVAGALHVVAGPDHLAAVAPLAADGRQRLWRSGLLWGLGHTGGVVLVGLLALLSRGFLPVEALSSVSERVVGVALIGVGIWGLRRAFRLRLHIHTHEHDGTRHTHVHMHGSADRHAPDEHGATHSHAHVHAALSFGILHGLAGSSHLFGVLPALALPTRADAVTYLAAYGAGTIAAMTLFSSLMGLLAAGARQRGAPVYRYLLYACSGAAIAVGGAWLVT